MTLPALTKIWRLRLCAFLTSLILGLTLQAQPASEPGSEPQPTPQMEFPAEADFLLLTYDRISTMLAEQSPDPRLRIYGDGTVLVSYPPYMTRAGEYSLQLSPRELDALLLSLFHQGIMTFDPPAVVAQRRQAEAVRLAQQGTFLEVSDDTLTVIEIHLPVFAPSGEESGEEPQDLRQEIVWPNLKWEMRHYGAVEAIQGLAAAEQELRQLLERDDLLRIEEVER